MIKIVSLSGSPVAGASTDILLGRIAECIVKSLGEQPADVSFVKLNSIMFRPCQSCGVDPTPRWCFYDDMGDVLDKIAKCDCLLFGSPVYFDTVSAQAKMLIDRCNCFRPAEFGDDDDEVGFIKRISRTRPGAMVLVGGENGYFEGARRTIAGYFKWIEVTNEGLLTYSSSSMNKRGTAADDAEILAEADKLGQHLAGILLERANKDGV